MSQSLSVSIKSNAPELSRVMKFLAKDQIPFAVSRTINSLAYDVRDQEQGNIDQHFNLRTPWLRKRGAMPVIKSHKRQSPNISRIREAVSIASGETNNIVSAPVADITATGNNLPIIGTITWV